MNPIFQVQCSVSQNITQNQSELPQQTKQITPLTYCPIIHIFSHVVHIFQCWTFGTENTRSIDYYLGVILCACAFRSNRSSAAFSVGLVVIFIYSYISKTHKIKHNPLLHGFVHYQRLCQCNITT